MIMPSPRDVMRFMTCSDDLGFHGRVSKEGKRQYISCAGYDALDWYQGLQAVCLERMCWGHATTLVHSCASFIAFGTTDRGGRWGNRYVGVSLDSTNWLLTWIVHFWSCMNDRGWRTTPNCNSLRQDVYIA